MIAKIFDNYTDGLIDAFKRETHNSVFTIDTYEHWDNIDGKPMVRIKFMHDPMVYVSHGIQAQYIHAMYTNIWSCMDKQSRLITKDRHDTSVQ